MFFNLKPFSTPIVVGTTDSFIRKFANAVYLEL